MFRLGEAILQTLLEAGDSLNEGGKDPIFVMQAKYPRTAARDIASELTVLAAQGYIKLTAKNGAVITAAGLRKIQDFKDDETDISSAIEILKLGDNLNQHSAPTRVEDENSELELDDIIELISLEKVSSTSSPEPEQGRNEYLPPTLEEGEGEEPTIDAYQELILAPLPDLAITPVHTHSPEGPSPAQMINLRAEIERLQREIAKLEEDKPTHYSRLVNITRDLEQATNHLDAFIRDLIPPKN